MSKQNKNYKFLSSLSDQIANHPIFSKQLDHITHMLDMQASKYYDESKEGEKWPVQHITLNPPTKKEGEKAY